MIKILFFIETIDGGGAEKVLCNLVNNMDSRKYDITVQTVWPCNPSKYLSESVHYKSMYVRKNKMTVLRYRLEAALGLAYSQHINADYDVECAYLESGATKVLSSSTNKKAIKLAWVHCDIAKLIKDPESFAVKTTGYYSKYDKIVCVSERGKESFDKLFKNAFDSVVVYNTVDCVEIKRKALIQVEGLASNEVPLIVSVGRLAEPKNFLRVLKAHKRLLDCGISNRLIIVGEGPERGVLEEFIDRNKLFSSVELTGFKSNPYPYIKAADIAVCSSDYECYSTFMTEAAILGKPIVTTDATGMREILGNSEFGLITDVDDDAFYEGVKRMLTDKELRKHYSERSAIRGNDFSTEKTVSATEAFIENCLKQVEK